MPYTLQEWLNLSVRWFHVFAAIMWVGQTYFFTWLEHRLTEAAASSDANGKVWMVHSGGFYIVDKQKVPELLPQKLHWFKWEAAFTWISGFLLFGLVYYHGGLLVDDSVRSMSRGAAIGISLGGLAIAWALYDALWMSPLARHEAAGVVVSYLLLVAAAFGFAHLFSGRGAYMQIGATMGTLMAANVWMRILPAQRQLIAARRAGNEPDMMLAERAKFRSKHNTYMVVPVVFIMISNHFPVATYGHAGNWAILAALILIGWGVAHLIRSH